MHHFTRYLIILHGISSYYTVSHHFTKYLFILHHLINTGARKINPLCAIASGPTYYRMCSLTIECVLLLIQVHEKSILFALLPAGLLWTAEEGSERGLGLFFATYVGLFCHICTPQPTPQNRHNNQPAKPSRSLVFSYYRICSLPTECVLLL